MHMTIGHSHTRSFNIFPGRCHPPSLTISKARTAFSGISLRSAGPATRTARKSKSAAVTTCLQEITPENFETEVMKSDVPVLLDFWADWCGPCKLITPLMESLEKEFEGSLKVVKVEVDGNPDLVSKYKVCGLPTLILMKNGEPVEGSQHEGAVTKAFLQSYLEKRGVVPVNA